MDFGGQPLLKMNNGLMIPQLGFGVLGIGELADTEKACLEAIKIGFRHIDTAHLYDNERGVGAALKKCGLPRKDIFITTKLAPTDLLDNKSINFCVTNEKSHGKLNVTFLIFSYYISRYENKIVTLQHLKGLINNERRSEDCNLPDRRRTNTD